MTFLPPLPIDAARPDITARLLAKSTLILVAPPGAGKTTRVPLYFLTDGLLDQGSLIMLQPRRIAARAAARRLAAQLGEETGLRAGYITRDETRVSPATKLAVATEGVLTRQILDDPFLTGVSIVFLDEFHERNLTTDLALVLLQHIRKTVRPDLKLVIGSATLDPGPLETYFEEHGFSASTLEVPVPVFPVDIRHEDSYDRRPLALRAAAAVARALDSSGEGDVLVFLPGASDIKKTNEALEPLLKTRRAVSSVLHGELPPDKQDAALSPAPGGLRKVVLSTNVAETSLTIEGVRHVIDSGLSRVARLDPRTGMTRLDTERISRASARQRAGRAGRTAPGTAFRLYTENDERSARPFGEPEIRRSDLSGAVLSLLDLDPRPLEDFPWFEKPDPTRLALALEILRATGAVESDRPALTARGRKMAALPIHPRLAAIVLDSHAMGFLQEGATLAALLEEREVLTNAHAFSSPGSPLPRTASDLLYRMDLLYQNAAELDSRVASRVRRLSGRIFAMAGRQLGFKRKEVSSEEDLLALILSAYPDRVAKRTESGRYALESGQLAELSAASTVDHADLLVVLHLDASSGGVPKIRQASTVSLEMLATHGRRGALSERTIRRWDETGQRVVAEKQVTYGQLTVLSRETPVPLDEETSRILFDHARQNLASALPFGEEERRLAHRLVFLNHSAPDLGLPLLDEAALEEILEGLVHGKRRLLELQETNLKEAFLARMTRHERHLLDENAPESIAVPTGRLARLDYPGSGQPVLAIKLQELFGLARTPTVAGGKVPVLLHLLSPAGRPVQVTSDLESFWNSTYQTVRKELRGRYPKHPWPEDPWNAPPQRGAKRK